MLCMSIRRRNVYEVNFNALPCKALFPSRGKVYPEEIDLFFIKLKTMFFILGYEI